MNAVVEDLLCRVLDAGHLRPFGSMEWLKTWTIRTNGGGRSAIRLGGSTAGIDRWRVSGDRSMWDDRRLLDLRRADPTVVGHRRCMEFIGREERA